MSKRFNPHRFPEAVDLLGGAQEAARLLEASIQSVYFWKSGDRPFPAEKCPDVERLLKRKVRCEELRPDVDWATVRNRKAA